MIKIPLSELNNALPTVPFALLVGIGFDDRCFSAIDNINQDSCTYIFGILNAKKNEEPYPLAVEKFKASIKKDLKFLGEDKTSILDVIDETQIILQQMRQAGIDIVIDITSLSHELLVAIIGLLDNEKMLQKTTLLYTGASEYSYKLPAEKMWLSRGVKDIRSVLGFPGLMLPSRKLHLIVMAGFEVERAAEVIKRYEPSRLTIASGSRDTSISTEHHNLNVEFVERLKSFVEEQDSLVENMQQFEFSCTDPQETANSIIAYVNDYTNENTVICPLNTKLSTVGAALAALIQPEIQICYAQAAEYNTDGYAKACSEITIVSLSNFSYEKEHYQE